MSTITITLNGSAITGLTTNPSKVYTISDTDLQSLLNWAAVAFNPYIQTTYNPTGTVGFTPTNGQILQAWIQAWVNGTKTAVQQFQTPAPSVPAQIGIV